MKLITASNLFPRPDQPTCGMFNLQLFQSLGRLSEVRNLCIVPSWRVWQWQNIRRWECPQAAEFETRYHPVFYLPWVGRSQAVQFYRRGLRSYADEISRADAAYTAWLFPDGVAMTELAASAGVPSWIMVQGSDTYHLNNTVRRRVILDACAQAAGIVCVAAALADRLESAGVATDKLHVIPNGVDGERFRYRERRAAQIELEDRLDPHIRARVSADKVIVFVGNLVEVKGVDILIDACAAMREEPLEAWSLIVIGDGTDRRSLQQQCDRCGLTDRVAFAGSRPHEEIPVWMAAADCLVLPSRSEGMPNVLLEAMSVGCPVVATDVGACREVTAEYAASRIVPSEDPRRLGHAISEITALQYDRRDLALRQAGRFSWDKQASTILDLIQSES